MQWGLLVEFSCNSYCKIVSLELCWSKQTTSAITVSGCYNTMLVSLSDSYSDDEAISVSDSRYSSYPAYTDTDYFY